jgi:hypothetical protein
MIAKEEISRLAVCVKDDDVEASFTESYGLRRRHIGCSSGTTARGVTNFAPQVAAGEQGRRNVDRIHRSRNFRRRR